MKDHLHLAAHAAQRFALELAQILTFKEHVPTRRTIELQNCPASGGLATALEPRQHDDRGAGRDKIDAGINGPHQLCKLITDDFDHYLARVKTFYYFSTDGCIRNVFTEFLYDVVIDVRLQKGLADIPHGIGDVRLCDPSSARQRPEDRVKFFSQRLKHVSTLGS